MSNFKQFLKLFLMGLGGIFGIAALVVVLRSFYTIEEGYVGVLTTWREYTETVQPGLRWKNPFSQNVIEYSTLVNKTEFDNLTAYSHDQQIVERYKITISWAYNPDRIEELYKKYRNGLFTNVVVPMVQQNSKAILGQYTAQTIIQERDKLQNQLAHSLKTDLETYPIQIYEVKIEDVNFSKSYEAVIEQTAQKKQEIERARNELQRVDLENQQKVKIAESENKSIKLQADAKAYQIETETKADAEALRIQAEAESYAITVKSKAEAEALELKGQALQKHPTLVQMELARQWKGEVPKIQMDSKGGVIPMIKFE